MADINDKIAIIIPAYNPDSHFFNVASELAERFKYIIVVNDGATHEYDTVFAAVERIDNISVHRHDSNLGKGAAIKTALRKLADQAYSCCQGCITVDADGQHKIDDVIRVADYVESSPDIFVMGVRDFTQDVPARSKFGNVLTIFILKVFYGLKLSDSQTGLRFIPRRMYKSLCEVVGDGYEYELNCLLNLHKKHEAIVQIPISTVYIDNNSSSHFHPIKDSWKVYQVFLKFSLSSILSFVLDIVLFTFFLLLTSNVMWSTFGARILSGVVNFWMNRNYVFLTGLNQKLNHQVIGYISLWLVILVLSGSIVSLIENKGANFIVPFKIAVDSLLFLMSFYIQKNYIFRARN